MVDLFELLDVDGGGQLTQYEFVEGLLLARMVSVTKQSFVNHCFPNNHSLCKGPSLEGMVVRGTPFCRGLFDFPGRA